MWPDDIWIQKVHRHTERDKIRLNISSFLGSSHYWSNIRSFLGSGQ